MIKCQIGFMFMCLRVVSIPMNIGTFLNKKLYYGEKISL